jgi:hypothetical protein
VDPENEMLVMGIVASGVLVVNAPTPLQVVWLLALTGVLIVMGRRPGLDSPGGGGLRQPRPPTRAI